MLKYPQFDPVAFSLGHYDLPLLGQVSLDVRWYGLMYLIGFAAAWGLGRWRIATRSDSLLDAPQMGDLVFWGAIGVVLGGRFGYVLFYAWDHFIQNPLVLFRVWEGGMSFHGGFLGVVVATILFSWRYSLSLPRLSDFIAPLTPIGLGAGRLGNFINGELYGRVTDVPWAMSFRQPGIYRHPSQLYQFLLEGVVLFVVLWLYSRKPRPTLSVTGLFLIGYGIARFVVEFFREPDAHLGYLTGGMTMGQWLSLPMIVVGGGLVIYALRYHKAPQAPQESQPRVEKE